MKLNWSKRLEVANGIASALQYLHTRTPQALHRDVKSSNIGITIENNAKLIDWGLSKYIPTDKDLPKTNTTASYIFGTQGYQSPEVVIGNPYDAKSEIYSFGIVLIELFSGKVQGHYKEDNLVVSLASLAEDLPADTRCGEWPADVVKALVELIKVCIAPANKRVPSMQNVVRTLNHLISSNCGCATPSEAMIEKEYLELKKQVELYENEQKLLLRSKEEEAKGKELHECLICTSEVTMDEAIICSNVNIPKSERHVFCKLCFSSEVERQTHEDYKKYFLAHKAKIVCDACLRIPCTKEACVSLKGESKCLHQIHAFSDQVVAYKASPLMFSAYLKAVGSIKEAEIVEEMNKKHLVQLLDIENQFKNAASEKQKRGKDIIYMQYILIS
jgi:hypothetical protein